MDTIVLFSAILGIFKITQVDAALRCIECEHISWQEEQFDGAVHVYDLLRSKYNPACIADNPRDRNAYDQNLINQQQQQQQNTQGFFQNRYDVSETICPAISNTNRCNYIGGDLRIYLLNYDKEISLKMYVRNCINAVSIIDDGCYDRDTTHGYNEVKNFFQDRLQGFMGRVDVRHFQGRQCYCSSDLCYENINSSRNVAASMLCLVLALIGYIVIK